MLDGRDTREFWEARVRPYLGTEAELASVTAAGLPNCFARYTDWLERRALARALKDFPEHEPLLEIGCGYGRWFDFWGNRGRPFVGVDFTFSLLARAKTKHPESIWVVADVRHLPFPPACFRGVSSVKVLQCLPPEERFQAVKELFRVLAPEGYALLLEKIRDRDGSLPAEWVRWATLSGGIMVTWTGNEYAPLDRSIEALGRLFYRCFRGRPVDMAGLQGGSSSGLMRREWSRLYRTYLAIRKAVVRISKVFEPWIEKIIPPHWAVHGLFLFRKG